MCEITGIGRHPYIPNYRNWSKSSRIWGYRYDTVIHEIKDEDVIKVLYLVFNGASSHYWSDDNYRHTKAVCDIAACFMDSYSESCVVDSDIVNAGCILHDIGTSFEPHDINGAKFVADIARQNNLYTDKIEKICLCIKRHLGKYGCEKPETIEEWIVHLSDNIAANTLY